MVKMEVVSRSRQALIWTAVIALLSLVVSSENFVDQKNYYTPIPDPNARPPPAVTYTPPPYSSGGGHASPPPTHGRPSHGGGGHRGSPPANCGNPPSGGHRRTSPPPSRGGYSRPPTTPTPTPTTPTPTPTTPTPIPPTPTYGTPPTTPTTPTTPTPTPTTPTPIPPTPTYGTPPTTPTTPTTPTIPSPPFPFDPNSPPFTCTYWRNHPQLIWALFGWLGNIRTVFGGTIPATGANMNLLQALSNTRTDGLGELYREGTAALLNSMAHTRFPYTSDQVRDSFVRALSSNKAAAAQAQLFKMANEGRMKPKA